MNQIIKHCFLSPLRHIPGPLLARLTSKWLILVDLAGHRTETIHRLHRSAVRIGPNEVSFANIESVKELYGQRTASIKAPVYETFSIPPLGIFSLRDPSQHGQRRKLLSHAFSQSNLNDTEPLIVLQMQKLGVKVGASVGRPFDVLAGFRMFSLDVVGELFLGKSFGALDRDEPPTYLEDVDKHFLLCGLDASFPWLYSALSRIPVPAVQHFFRARQRLLKVANSDSTEAQLSDLETYVEIGNLVFAGTDSTTLTYLFWELARNPSWQEKIQKELETVHGGGREEVLTYDCVVELPVLNAVVNESLRVHPAAPASLPRETPPGGRILNNCFIPENTVVSMQCYTTQHDPTIYTDPDIWDPERWLSPSVLSFEWKELFMPFSKGLQACPGRNLALMKLKLVTAFLVDRYKVAVAPETTAESMAMRDHFLVVLKGGECKLVFWPVRKP
ncbi:hypothetical protein H2201_005414 [Coniosporium apollinis]|uniref:Cytochrome P450 n=1 Tax=Coniosporium apollinis TaxID=61459 RepID=A0ABQ9NT40_9PEZI|nr:hypothetical protein H2201_005414 [Coniosporium apollinis]